MVLISLNQCLLCETLSFDFRISNNEAKYKALIVGVMMAKELGIPCLMVHGDYQLVINQVNGTY